MGRQKGSKNRNVILRGGRFDGPLPSHKSILRAIAIADLGGEAELSLGKLIDLRDNAESEAVQLAAAIELKNTAFGKPKQQIDHGVAADLLKSVHELRKRRGLDV